MKKTGILLGCGLFLVGGLVILALVGFGSYNSFVTSSQKVDRQWAQVQNVYQRRADLIPNLVATVRGAADFEKTTLNEVVQARASVGQMKIDPSRAPTDPAVLEAFQKSQEQLSSALSRLLVVVEKYPDLKATAGFRDLQAQLEGTENRITVERQGFNEAVENYNTRVMKVPGRFIAGMFGFHPKPYFSAKAGAETPPEVKFEFGRPAATNR